MQAFREADAEVDITALAIWGDRDTHLDAELATPPADWVSHARVEHVSEAGHWVHHDAPDKVGALLLLSHFAPPAGVRAHAPPPA